MGFSSKFLNHEKNNQDNLCIFCAFATAGISAELNPPFQNNAVLQCDQRVPVWSSGREGEKITVAFAGQKISTIATNGIWKVWFDWVKPNTMPQNLMASDNPTSVITKASFGEV